MNPEALSDRIYRYLAGILEDPGACSGGDASHATAVIMGYIQDALVQREQMEPNRCIDCGDVIPDREILCRSCDTQYPYPKNKERRRRW